MTKIIPPDPIKIVKARFDKIDIKNINNGQIINTIII